MTASTLAIGMLVFASVLSASAGASAFRTASLVVGSESSAAFSGSPPDLDRLRLPATEVVRVAEAPVEPELADSLDILGVDPSSFERAAYWDSTFAPQPLDELLGRLEQDGAQVLPVILVGAPAPADNELLLTTHGIPARVVAQVGAWPGRVGERPTAILNTASLADALEEVGTSLEATADSRQIWTTARLDDLTTALAAQDVSVIEARSSEELTGAPSFLALTWMFGFLEVVGIATGLLVLLAMCLFLVARQRRGEAAYAISSRMGLSRRAHALSIAAELAGMLTISLIVGATAGGIAAWVMHSRIDVGTIEGVDALFKVPLTTIGAVVSVLAIFVVVGTWLVQRRADRTDFGQVMRYAD
jgi:putative ABC transport system permease protein